MRALLRSGVQFQSTLPARGATEWLDVGFNVSRPFQSTLPARGATATGTVYQPGYFLISIHAPRTGSDASTQERFASRAVISIHAPRTGSDISFFRSSPSVDISIHAPRTGSDKGDVVGRDILIFQSTLPARGATCSALRDVPRAAVFQSTLPARGATVSGAMEDADGEISIHAPRTGSDHRRGRTTDSHHISIHAPRTGSDGHNGV